MKRFILISVFLLSGMMTFADEVPQMQAEMLANKFFGCVTPQVKLANPPSNSDTQAPAYYIFNNPEGGWVVISGEDSTYPILAYSDVSSLDLSMMQGAIKYWFDGLKQDIYNARAASLEADEDIAFAWENIRDVSEISQICLNTATWGQGSPFNDLCPQISGEKGRSVSGCVATAMAIILRYHLYPEKGKGTIGGYYTRSKNHHIQEFSIDSHEYHMEDIPTNAQTGTWTTDQKSRVAQLVYDCGVMVEMDYSYNGSGAYSMDVLPALKEHMGYSRKGVYILRSMFSMGDWIDKLEAEIDASRPILYGGVDSEEGGGHQFIVDGYDETGKMHINWGWTGSGNGYYALDYLGDRKKIGYVFDDSQDAMIGIEPDPEGISEEPDPILCLSASSSGNGISLVSGTIAKGSSITLKFASVWNYFTSGAYNGSIRAAVIDCNDNLKEYIGNKKDLTIKFGYGSTISSYKATITKDIAPGDRIVLFYTGRSGNWLRMYGDKEGGTVDAYPLVNSCFIKCLPEYSAGQEYSFELISSLESISEVKWYFDAEQTNDYKVVLTEGDHTIKAKIKYSNGDTETISQKIKVK